MMRVRAAPILVWIAFLSPAPARGQSAVQPSSTGFRYERTVTPAAPGAVRLECDRDLLVHADPLAYVTSRSTGGEERLVFAGGLRDLRFYDANDREVPYLLVAPAEREAKWQQVVILATVPGARRTSGFEVDAGVGIAVDRLRVDGIPAPFLKRFRLEGSGDRQHWTLLIEQGTLFDLPEEGLKRTEVAFGAGAYRYLRLDWDDRSSARVPAPRSVEVRLAGAVPAPQPVRLPLAFERRPSEPGKSRFVVRLGGAHLPVACIEVVAGDGPLLREAAVSEARIVGNDVTLAQLGRATLRQAGRGALVASDLRIPIALPQEPELELVVDDGDNPPLQLHGVWGELAPLPWIYLESDQPVLARFGAPGVEPPRYDLEAKRNLVAGAKPAAASWSELRDLAPEGDIVPQSSPLPLSGAPVDPKIFRYWRTIPAGNPGLSIVQLDAAALAHSTLTDLRIGDPSGRQVPYLLEKREEPLIVDLKIGPRRAERPATDNEKGRNVSSYAVALPFDALPDCRFVLTTRARVFDREIRILGHARSPDPRSGADRVQLAALHWIHTAAERPAQALVVPLAVRGYSEIEVEIDEGDNSALPLQSARLLLPSYRLRFFHGAGAALALYYGQPQLGPPQYDLALLAPRLLGASAYELKLGEENASSGAQSRASQQVKLFWGAIVAAAVLMMFLLIRLLVRTDRPA